MASIATLVDRVKILVLSSGTGPFELGAAVPGYRGVEALTDGATYNYAGAQGSNFEVGTGVYLEASGTLVRTPLLSSSGGAAIAFSANLELNFTILAQDVTPAGSLPIVQVEGTGEQVAMSQKAVTDALAAKLDGAGVESLGDVTGILSIINGTTVQASEAIGARNFVNVFNSGGNLRVRKADALDPAKFANGFAPSVINSGASGIVIFNGLNADGTVAAPAAEVWLSDATPGTFATSPPSASGSIIQPLGPAVAGLGIFFTLRERVLL